MAEWKKIITSGSHAELAGVTGSKGFHGSGTDLTFSDTDHWNEFGEIYFGKRLVFNSIMKDILFE